MEDSLFGKPARNFAPRTIWTGDNLDILRGINSETVDLIYLDKRQRRARRAAGARPGA